MTLNPGATTRTVQPTPQIDSLRMSGYEQPGVPVAVSPEVARYQIEQDLARLAQMANLTTRELNYASLHPEERAKLEGQIDIYEEPSVSENLWADTTEPVETAPVQQDTEPIGEAAIVAAIEQMDSNEELYQIIIAGGPQFTNRLRVNGMAHPERVLERVKADYEISGQRG